MNSPKIVVDALKHQKINEHVRISSAYLEEPNLGMRKTMEDFVIHEPDLLDDGRYSLYCVLDGHGGADVAEYLYKHFPKLIKDNLVTYESIYNIDEIFALTLTTIENNMRLINSRETGSTFCAVFIDRKLKEMYVVNIGDSQMLQVVCEDDRKLSSGFLCKSHKTTNKEEMMRISRSGGNVKNGRVGGFLMLTRSIGDFSLKKYGLISTPDIEQYAVDTASLLILCSDGIWDYVQPEDVMNIIVANQDYDCEAIARTLIQEAIIKGSLDNISAICVLIY